MFRPVHPSIILKARCEERRLSLEDFAAQVGFSMEWLNDFMHYRVVLDNRRAEKIATFFHDEPSFWTEKMHQWINYKKYYD